MSVLLPLRLGRKDVLGTAIDFSAGGKWVSELDFTAVGIGRAGEGIGVDILGSGGSRDLERVS